MNIIHDTIYSNCKVDENLKIKPKRNRLYNQLITSKIIASVTTINNGKKYPLKNIS